MSNPNSAIDINTFWNSTSKTPVQSEKVSYPTLNGLTYSSNSNNKILIQIPADVGFIQPSDTYLKCQIDYDLTLTQSGTDTVLGDITQRLQLIPELGASAIIRNMIIKDGYGNELESIQNANSLSAIKLMYDDDPSKRSKRCSTEGCVDWDFRCRSNGEGGEVEKLRSYNVTTNPYFKNQGTKAPVSVCIPFHCSGLLSEINQKLLPVKLLNGLVIELQLEEPRNCFRGLRNAIALREAGDAGYLCTLSHAGWNGSSSAPGAGMAGPGSSYDSVFLENKFPYGGANITNIPFVVGELIGVTLVASPGDIPEVLGKITSILTDGTYIKISFTGTKASSQFEAQTNTYLAGSYISSCGLHAPNGRGAGVMTRSLTYSVSNVSVVCKRCIVSPDYIKSMERALTENGSIVYSFLAYQNYQRTVNSAELQPTMDLNLNNSMCKAILHQPTTSNSNLVECLMNFMTHNTSYFKLSGDALKAENYAVFWAGRQNPDRDIDLLKTSNTAGSSQRAISQLHQALTQSNISATNWNNFKSNFVIGKSMSLGNGVADVRGQDYQLRLLYNSVTSNKNFNNFVSHIKRISINNNNVDVIH
jgi:hypothetical protein